MTSRADTRFKAKVRAKLHNDLSRVLRKPYFWVRGSFYDRRDTKRARHAAQSAQFKQTGALL